LSAPVAVVTCPAFAWPQGLIFTAGSLYKILHALNIPVHVQEVCASAVGPFFSQWFASFRHASSQHHSTASKEAKAVAREVAVEAALPDAQVCVFTAPLFSSFCALACYGLVREVRGDGAGLLAAMFVGIVSAAVGTHALLASLATLPERHHCPAGPLLHLPLSGRLL
jgi:hypothetical protein